MITKVTTALSRARSKDTASNLAVGNKAKYDVRYEPTDFSDDNLITKYFFDSQVPTGVTSPIALTPYNAGTSLPITINSFQVDYSAYGTYPTIMVFYTDTGEEIVNKTVIRSPLVSPTTVTINAANDGNNITDGKITIVIKQ